jgi:hypothetical protein
MANKCMRNCSTFIAIKEMQIKTTLGLHLTPVRMTIIKQTNNNKYCQGYRGKKNTNTLSVGMQISAALWKKAWRSLKN